ncbi:MAG TPA: LamG domain-containing protein, partial [Humisphaera sp.]
SGPGAVTFAPNGTNAAKAAGATFTLAGTYVLRATVTDAGGKTATSDVTVTVAQVLTDVGVAPPLASLANGQSQQFAAIARDQFGSAMAAQPSFAWAVDAGGVGTVTAAGLYTAPAAGVGTATVRATGGGKSGTATVTVYASTGDVTTGLADRWAFDEAAGTAAADPVGGRTGTLTNGPTWAAGRSGSAVALDGVNDYVATAGNLGAVLGGTATLTAWVKTTQAGAANFWDSPGITGVEQYWGNDDVFWGYLTPTGRIAVQAGDGAAAASTTAVNDGQWHHVAFTRDAATGALQAYVDGALQATATGETGLKSVPFSSIGRIEATQGPAAYFAGALDEVRIYNRVLTAAEVVAVRNASTGSATTSSSTASPTVTSIPTDAAPTVAVAAKATPSAPYAGVPTALSALGADDGGEANLTYAWSVTSAPTGATVAFGATGTNAAKSTTATFGAAGTYVLRCTISDGGASVTTGVTVTVAAFSTAKVNFQPAAAATVSGYLAEGGGTFAARNSSLSFGWNTAHTASTYDRGTNANQLLDTVTLMKAGSKWEVAVPSGTYSVKVSVGDAKAPATNTVRVEGTTAFSAVATAANAFQTKTVSVKVTDGRLTIDNGSAADLTTALNYVEITRTGA